MEASVRYLHFNDSGCKPALGFRGRTIVHAVVNDEELIRVKRVDPREWDRMRSVPFRGDVYPIDRMRKHLLKLGKPMTQAARDLLERDCEPDSQSAPTPSATPTAKPERTSTPNLLAAICAELKIEPAAARRRLRAAGLKAPYDDASAIRNVLKGESK